MLVSEDLSLVKTNVLVNKEFANVLIKFGVILPR